MACESAAGSVSGSGSPGALSRSQVLVFDEATSALDNESEERVMEAFAIFKDPRTVIIVAHRLSTLNIVIT